MNRVFLNVLITLAVQLFSWALTFAVTLYVPRYIGDVGLGKLAFASSITAIIGVVAPLGLTTVLIKEISRNRETTIPLVRAAFLLRIPLSIALMALAVLIVWALGYPYSTCLLVAVSGVGVVVYNANDIVAAVLQGQEDISRKSRSVIADKVCGAILMIGLVIAGAPLWTLAGVAIITGLLSFVINLSALPLLRWTRDHSPNPVGLLLFAKQGLPFLGWYVFQTLYGKCDPIILSLVANDATVGWYDAGMRLVGSTLIIPNAMGGALLPTLNRLYATDSVKFRELANRMLTLMIICGVPISVVLTCVPDQIIGLLHYPSSFLHSSPVLRIGGIGVLLWFVACAAGTTVTAADGQTRMCRAAIIASILGIPWCLLASWFSHHFFGNGAAGAMFSDVTLEAGLLVAYIRILPRGFYAGECFSLLFRCTLAALPMVGFMFWAGPSWGLWAVLPATISYVVSCLVLRCIDMEYLHMLRSIVTRKQEGI